jgi:hypothetical protein
MPAFNLSMNSVRLAYALTLNCGFLTRLSQPLGPVDIVSTGCHPSQTTHLQLFLARDKQYRS